MFSSFLDKQFKSIIDNLEKFPGTQDPENIHDIRVGIKKLRAVFSFLRKAGGEDSTPKKMFDNLFDEAGELREAQMNIKLLEQFDGTEQIIESLKEKEKKISGAFILKTPAFINEVKKYQQGIIRSNEEPAGKQVKKYFEKLIHRCKALLAGKPDPEDLHHFRMKIKKLMYIFDSLPASLAHSIGLNVKYIERIQDMAGDWHDAFVAWEFLLSVHPLPEGLLDQSLKDEQKKQHSLVKLCEDFEKNIHRN